MTRVLLTRPTAEDRFARALAAAGLDPVPVPLTRTVPGSPRALRRTPDLLTGAAWVALTSPTAVRVLDETLHATGLRTADVLAATQVAAVGRATERALTEIGVRTRLRPAPDREDAAGLARAFPVAPADTAVHRVVLPTSRLASPVLAEGLRAKGWGAQRLELYSTEQVNRTAVDASVTRPWPEALVVTSGSNARALLDLLGAPPAGTVLVTLGEPTARVCRELGLPEPTVAREPTPEAVVTALQGALGRPAR